MCGIFFLGVGVTLKNTQKIQYKKIKYLYGNMLNSGQEILKIEKISGVKDIKERMGAKEIFI